MKKLVRNIFPILLFSFMLTCFLFSKITAQQKKWVVYHGDFCKFKIMYDYELDYKQSGSSFTYTIYDPENKDKKLIMSSRHMKMKFHLPGKNGYKTQYSGALKVENTRGVEKKGVTKNETHWREVYLYHSIRGPMGPDTSLIHVYYDDVDGPQSVVFNEIINSIEVNNPYKIKITPTYP